MYKQKVIAVSILIGSGLIPYMANAETSAPSTTPTPVAAPATSSTPPAPEAKTPAAAPEEDTESTTVMSKAKWLDAITPMLPSLICKGFMGDPDLKKRLDAIKMTYEQCVSVIPESVSKCQNQLSASIPEKISNAEAATWGKNLGECIGKDFATKYLIPK